MGKIYKSITEFVGHTPLLELTNYEKKHNLPATLLAKLEYMNPTGSVKDRAAWNMLKDAIDSGSLKPGQTIVDNTSGNTGISEAAFAHATGHEFVTFLEPGVSKEREDIFAAYGVEQHWFEDISQGVRDALERGEIAVPVIQEGMHEYADKHGYYYLDQCGNQKNTDAHYETTGPEIWEDTDGKVDILVAMVGTGGTISGLEKYFKEKNPDIQIIAVQPDEKSRLDANNDNGDTIDGVVPLASNGEYFPDGLQPPLVLSNGTKYDELISVYSGDAFATGREIVRTDGLFVGMSAAAAIFAAKQVAERPENAGKNIVVILADDGTKYLSTNMYKERQ